MLILDFDGVLADTERIHFAAWRQTFEQLLGLRIEGDHRQLVGLSLDQILALWSPNLTEEQKRTLLAHKTELFFQIGAGKLTPLPGSVDLIRQSRSSGWYVGVASRAKRLRLHRTLEVMQMPASFDVVLGEEDCVNPMTDRKEHARAAAKFGIDPAGCVVIEDSVTGVRDAVACGIGRVIGLTSMLQADLLRAAGAHEIVASLTEIVLPEV
jgi:beta-phosphoglucomutase-like phosphatase (HAD superfamily)